MLGALQSFFRIVAKIIAGFLITVGVVLAPPPQPAARTTEIIRPPASPEFPALKIIRNAATTSPASMQTAPTAEEPTKKPENPAQTKNPQPLVGTQTSEMATTSKEQPLAAPTSPAPPPLVPLPELNQVVREAVVNILCTTKQGGDLSPISGSGVIIDTRGIILTNAHIAQYLLLKDYRTADFVSCAVRIGSPARMAYRITPLFISPVWIEKNAALITASKPTGTGEHDYALLWITDSVNPQTPLPAQFPSVPVGIDFNPESDHPVLLVSYPAGFLGSIAIQQNLNALSSADTIKRLFTFSADTPRNLDTFSLGGSIVAQSGSSGGAVVERRFGALVGIITTSADARTTKERDLNAISVDHISRSLQQQTGGDLFSFLSRNLEQLRDEFRNTEFERLKTLLINAIEK